MQANGLLRIGDVPVYAVDALVRRAGALQQTPLAEPAQLRISTELAKQLGLHNAAKAQAKQNSSTVVLPLVIDDSVPAGCAWIASGLPESVELGAAFGDIELSAA